MVIPASAVHNTGGKDAKTRIIELLTKCSPLPARQLYKKICQEEPMAKLTYQGLYKALHSLEQTGVVAKDAKKSYSLHPTWVSGTEKMLEKVKRRAGGNSFVSLTDIPENTSVTVDYYGTYATPHYWLVSELDELVKQRGKRDKPTVMHQCGAWPIMLMTDKEFKQLANFVDPGNFFILCTTDSYYDRKTLEFWEKKFGAKWKAGIKGIYCEAIAIYDYAILKFEDPEVLKLAEKMQNHSNKVKSIDLPELYEAIVEKQARLHFIVIRSAAAADSIRAEAARHFPEIFAKKRA